MVQVINIFLTYYFTYLFIFQNYLLVLDIIFVTARKLHWRFLFLIGLISIFRCEKRVACFPQLRGQYINPNSFIPLKVECLEDCGSIGELSFEWKVFESDLETFKKDPIENCEAHTQGI